MKNRFTHLVLAVILLLSVSFIPGVQINDNYTGKWKFEAPDAPEGSTSGNILIKTNIVVMSFDDFEEFPSSWVRFRNDSIIYETSFDLATVLFSLRVVDKNNMKGKAVWKDGETEITLKKTIIGVRL